MIKLISVTEPKIEGINTAEELISYCARVSNPKNQFNKETSSKLLEYCAKHSHWSIFEMVDITMQIETTRDIGRQILRHRSFSFQEFSQRYAKVQGFAERECRIQDNKNRQNSFEVETNSCVSTWFSESQEKVKNMSQDLYNEALQRGIAKEQARALLPEGLTLSNMYMKGSLRSWIHYVQLRCGDETQKEHRVIAQGAKKIILELFPSLKTILE